MQMQWENGMHKLHKAFPERWRGFWGLVEGGRMVGFEGVCIGRLTPSRIFLGVNRFI